MAKPRVFISSTFYDLKFIREELDRFIRDQGFDSVRHEKSSIPYGKDLPLEQYAYKEVDNCDIFVNVIGGKFGTQSLIDQTTSITQNEVKRAIEKGIPIYFFVENNVLTEYSTYQLNKENPTVSYRFVDDQRIFHFLDFIYLLPRNNPIVGFQFAQDIVVALRDQWAGLFQRFLQDQQRMSEINLVGEMKSVSSTLQQLVHFITEERKSSDDAVKTILQYNNPVFRRLASLTGTDYRVFFLNKSEMDNWLAARGWQMIELDGTNSLKYSYWNKKDKASINFKTEIFDDRKQLVTFSEIEWDNESIVKIADDFDPNAYVDDIPF